MNFREKYFLINPNVRSIVTLKSILGSHILIATLVALNEIELIIRKSLKL